MLEPGIDLLVQLGWFEVFKKAATYQRKTKAARFETVPSDL